MSAPVNRDEPRTEAGRALVLDMVTRDLDASMPWEDGDWHWFAKRVAGVEAALLAELRAKVLREFAIGPFDDPGSDLRRVLALLSEDQS